MPLRLTKPDVGRIVTRAFPPPGRAPSSWRRSACDGRSGAVLSGKSQSARSVYAGYRFPPEIISHAVWLYFRFPLSLRMVEEMLAVRGIVVSHTVGGGYTDSATAELALGLLIAAARGIPRNHPDLSAPGNSDTSSSSPYVFGQLHPRTMNLASNCDLLDA